MRSSEAGGFDESIPAGPEDWDLHERVRARGGGVQRTDALIWHDEGRLRLRETMATKFYYGKGTEVYMRRHADPRPKAGCGSSGPRSSGTGEGLHGSP